MVWLETCSSSLSADNAVVSFSSVAGVAVVAFCFLERLDDALLRPVSREKNIKFLKRVLKD